MDMRIDEDHQQRASLAVSLARWLEARLHETTGFHRGRASLYGLTVIDERHVGDGCPVAARMCFVSDGVDVESAVRHAPPELWSFDAVGVVATELLPRRRALARVVVVATDVGSASALRCDAAPSAVSIGLDGGTIGAELCRRLTADRSR